MVRQDDVPSLQGLVLMSHFKSVEAAPGPPGCSLLWFDKLVCHQVHAVWGGCVTGRAMSFLSHKVTLIPEGITWKSTCTTRLSFFFSIFCVCFPFLAPDIGVWKRHICSSTLLQNALFRVFSAISRKWTCGE